MYTLRVEDRFFDTPNELCFEKLEESQTHSLNVKGGTSDSNVRTPERNVPAFAG